MFYKDVLQAHETAHQWWGNRVTPATYRDNWLMEALANYSALLYLEKRRGTKSVETMLDNYRDSLLAKSEDGEPRGLGRPDRAGHAAGNLAGAARLARHHLRQGKLDHAHAARAHRRPEVPRDAGRNQPRYDRKDITTEEFRLLASEYLPPKSDDPKLETLLRPVGLRHRDSGRSN